MASAVQYYNFDVFYSFRIKMLHNINHNVRYINKRHKQKCGRDNLDSNIFISTKIEQKRTTTSGQLADNTCRIRGVLDNSRPYFLDDLNKIREQENTLKEENK